MKFAPPLLLIALLVSLTGCDLFSKSDTTPAAPAVEDATPQPTSDNAVRVVIETNKGDIHLELWPDKAPKTVANFLAYIDARHYDGTIFHRIARGGIGVIQGGGFSPRLRRLPTGGPIANEARADVSNLRGTIAMARTNHPHSATDQFYINQRDNTALDFRAPNEDDYGYCVFGTVTQGMDVVDAIYTAQTADISVPGGVMGGVPIDPIIITSIRRGN